MPTFELLSITEAKANSATGKRAQLMREYMDYIDGVPAGQAGRLQASPEESAGAVRRRLGAAAKALGRTLVIKRANETVFFWVASQPGRRRGRPPKNPAP